MQLENLIDKFPGATIGVLGSSPSLLEFKDRISECDIVIACNGSLLALNPKIHAVDYFLCGDESAWKRQWFNCSSEFRSAKNESCIRVLPSFLLPFDKLALPNANLRTGIAKSLKNFKRSLSDGGDYIYFKPQINMQELCNCVIFDYAELVSNNINDIVSKKAQLFRGATISGVAAQMAYKIGANRIALFGCEFNNGIHGSSYAYDANGDTGSTREIQRINMDFILNHLKRAGIEILSYGETNLRSAKII